MAITTGATGFRMANLVAALPDFALAGVFLITWMAPGTFGDRVVTSLMLLMILEFITVHSSALLGQVYISPDPRGLKLAKLLGLALFYNVFVVTMSMFSETLWPIFAFWGLTLNKLLGVILARTPGAAEKDRLRREWGTGCVLYILLCILCLFLPLPRLGITEAVIGGQEIPGKGIWVDQPFRVIAFGFLYFLVFGISEILGHPWFRVGNVEEDGEDGEDSAAGEGARPARQASPVVVGELPDGPDTLEMRSGGGWLNIIGGLPFFLAGLLVTTVTFWAPLIGGEMTSEVGKATILSVSFGLPLTALGAALVLGRKGVVLDRRARTVTTWWGLLVPFGRAVRSLEGVGAVRISPEVQSGRNGSRVVYVVKLGKPLGAVKLKEEPKYLNARRRAEEIANFLQLGLEDETGEEPVRREAGTLDLTLREKLEREGARLELPPRPAGTRARYECRGDEHHVEIPPRGFRGMGPPVLISGIFILICLFSSFPFFLIWPFMVLPVLVLAWLFHRCILVSHRLVVSPRGVQLERRGTVFSRTRHIPVEELEDLEVEGPAVTAVSDREVLSFGGGLPEEELRWLWSLTRHAIGAPPGDRRSGSPVAGIRRSLSG